MTGPAEGVKLTLKDCPFCGWLPVVLPLDPSTEGNAWGKVVCMNPGCPTFDAIRGQGVSVSDGEDCADERGSDVYKQVAIARWNQHS